MNKYLLIIFYLTAYSSFSQIPSSGLVGKWWFTGNSNDGTGSGNNGTIYGATLTEDRCGNPNQAYYFDGNDYIECTAHDMGVSNEVTISLWFKTASASMDCMLSKYSWSNDVGYCIQMEIWSAPELRGRDGNGVFIETNTDQEPRNFDKWHHVVGVVNDSIWTTYIDGDTVGWFNTGHSSVNVGTSNLPLTFGRLAEYTNVSWRYYTGALDDIAIYNRAIDYDEVLQLFNDNCEGVLNTTKREVPAIKVYPNPSRGQYQMNLENAEFSQISAVYLFDAQGKIVSFDKVSFTKNGRIDLSGKSPGYYYLGIILNGEAYQLKLMLI